MVMRKIITAILLQIDVEVFDIFVIITFHEAYRHLYLYSHFIPKPIRSN